MFWCRMLQGFPIRSLTSHEYFPNLSHKSTLTIFTVKLNSSILSHIILYYCPLLPLTMFFTLGSPSRQFQCFGIFLKDTFTLKLAHALCDLGHSPCSITQSHQPKDQTIRDKTMFTIHSNLMKGYSLLPVSGHAFANFSALVIFLRCFHAQARLRIMRLRSQSLLYNTTSSTKRLNNGLQNDVYSSFATDSGKEHSPLSVNLPVKIQLEMLRTILWI